MKIRTARAAGCCCDLRVEVKQMFLLSTGQGYRQPWSRASVQRWKLTQVAYSLMVKLAVERKSLIRAPRRSLQVLGRNSLQLLRLVLLALMRSPTSWDRNSDLCPRFSTFPRSWSGPILLLRLLLFCFDMWKTFCPFVSLPFPIFGLPFCYLSSALYRFSTS